MDLDAVGTPHVNAVGLTSASQTHSLRYTMVNHGVPAVPTYSMASVVGVPMGAPM